MKSYSSLVLILSLAIGLAFSFILGWSFYDLETRSIASQFGRDVDSHVSSIEREITLNFETVHALKGLYDSSEHVTDAEFKRFASGLLARHNNIQALEWIPKVSLEDRASFEKKRQQDYPSFTITERSREGKMATASERDVYFPVSYLEPYTGNETALGFDLASNEQRLKALVESQQSGKLISTASITLVQETENQKGFLVFLPIYKGLPTTKDQRVENLLGFVLGVFRIGDLVEHSIAYSPKQNINFNLIDITVTPPETLFEYNVPLTKKIADPDFLYSKTLAPIGGRQWSILSSPTDKYFTEHRSSTPFVITLLVTVFIFFGVAYVFLLARHAATVEEAVLEKTFELNDTKNELERISLSDGLTGIANRRHFDAYLEQEWARAIRDKQPLSLIMLDIDHFKKFNDHYGHLAGDSCLKMVAHTLDNTAQRATDLVARYGGEEFAIILPNVADAAVVAEKCRTNIEKEEIAHVESDVADHVTVSIGYATITPTVEMRLITLVNSADGALYKAKNTGRNKIYTL